MFKKLSIFLICTVALLVGVPFLRKQLAAPDLVIAGRASSVKSQLQSSSATNSHNLGSVCDPLPVPDIEYVGDYTPAVELTEQSETVLKELGVSEGKTVHATADMDFDYSPAFEVEIGKVNALRLHHESLEGKDPFKDGTTGHLLKWQPSMPTNLRKTYRGITLVMAAIKAETFPFFSLATFKESSGEKGELVATISPSYWCWEDLFVVDMDGDGLLEVFFSGGMGTGYSALTVLTLQPDGRLTPHQVMDESELCCEIGTTKLEVSDEISTDRGHFGLADFNDDGRLEIAVFEGLWHTCFTNDYYLAAYERDSKTSVWNCQSATLLAGKSDQRKFYAAKLDAIRQMLDKGSAIVAPKGCNGEELPLFVFDKHLYKVSESLGFSDKSSAEHYPELLDHCIY